MLKVWGRKSSSNVQAVMWCIGELGLDCDRIDAGLSYGVVETPEYLNDNPNGTVPMLKDGDSQPLWESGAILRYLANSYGNEAFWPSDPLARASVDKWAEWSKINIALNFTRPIFWEVVRTPQSKQNPTTIKNGINRLTPFLNIAEAHLSRNAFLAANNLTLADIQFGHCLYRYFDIDIARVHLPNLRRYYDLLASREMFQRHVMVSYDELRQSD